MSTCYSQALLQCQAVTTALAPFTKQHHCFLHPRTLIYVVFLQIMVEIAAQIDLIYASDARVSLQCSGEAEAGDKLGLR